MIGIDTNVLLRLWLNDDPALNKRMDTLLAHESQAPASVFVTDVVLVEAVWTLRTVYQQDKAAQVLAVRSLLEETAFALQDRDGITHALALFEASNCGFSDCLVVARHQQTACTQTATFDRAMKKLTGVRLL